MNAGFYSLEMAVLLHLAARYHAPDTVEYCGWQFLDALAQENNQ